MGWARRIARALTALASLALALVALVLAAGAALAQTTEMAAPYEYLGWGNPQQPASVIAASGIHDLTLAFILSHGSCNPAWDGARPLLGGPDQAAIEAIRQAGGDVAVSVGGWSGKKLGSTCKSANSLAAAYQKVVGAYALKAIDIDIEHTEFASAKVRKRVVQALAILQREDPTLEISITFPTGESGPEADGQSLIADAAAIGFQPNAWTVMPFDFGVPVSDMAQASIAAVEGLAGDLAAAYHVSAASAYQHSGVSSMNGQTDEPDETVGLEDFQRIVAFAAQEHLARVSFWAVNRDRPCGGEDSEPGEDCSGISQQPYAFTDLLSEYHG